MLCVACCCKWAIFFTLTHKGVVVWKRYPSIIASIYYLIYARLSKNLALKLGNNRCLLKV